MNQAQHLVTDFKVDVPDEVLADLLARLKLTRWANDFANDDWAYGTNQAYLESLVHYWQTQYDWRKHEREINSWPHFKTDIGGIPIHFMRIRGQWARPKPLILHARLAVDVLGL